MTNQEAIEVLYSMLQRAAPCMYTQKEQYDGRPVSPAFNALSMAIDALQEPQPKKRGPYTPARACQPWTEDENQRLREGFTRGETVATLARQHQRTQSAIRWRLEILGLVEQTDAARRPEQKKSSHRS